MTGNRLRIACVLALGGALLPIWPCAAQTIGQGEDLGISLWRIAGAMLFTIVIGGAILIWARSRGAALQIWTPAKERRLTVIETVRVTPQAVLCLAALGGREYLIAITSGAATLIETRDGGCEAL